MTAFSIVIPAYNAATTLAATLASVDFQTERDFEVIIVDDGSTDGTAELAEGLLEGRRGKVLRQANAGPSAARNAAIAVAEGRWIALLDADDWYLPNYLARMRSLLESAPRVGLVFGDAWIWDERRRRFARRSSSGPYLPRSIPQDREEQWRTLLEVNYVYGATCYPRELVLELGGYDETLRAAEDWQLWLRMVASPWRVIGVPDRLAVYRHRTGQATRDPQLMWEGTLLALRSLETLDLPEHLRAMVPGRVARHEALQPGQAVPRHWARDLAGRLTRPLSPVRDFRLRPPREVVEALPELA